MGIIEKSGNDSDSGPLKHGRFIQERTSIHIRKDEEDLIELPSSYTKRRIYERYACNLFPTLLIVVYF